MTDSQQEDKLAHEQAELDKLAAGGATDEELEIAIHKIRI